MMEYKITIPQQLSIIGIGDFAGSGEMYPSLTTVRIPAKTIGEKAGEYLAQSIGRYDASNISRIKIPVEIKQRTTTGLHKKYKD